MPIEKKHQRVLELDKILNMLADCTSCDDGKEKALALEPQTSLYRAREEMRQTADANVLSNRYGAPTIYHFKNIKSMVKRAELGTSLSLRELLEISNALRTVRALSDWRKHCEKAETSLDYLFSGLTPHPFIEDRINTAILSEDMVADNASPALADIRRKIRNAGLSVKNQLDKLIHSPAYQKYLQESLVTMRDGRYVVPVKAEHRSEIKGLVHDTSSSGATLFIEPLGVVEANNEIRLLQGKESDEIARIVAELSALIGEYSQSILQDYDSVVEIDLIFAKSRLADKMQATEPALNDDGIIRLKKARHPMIAKNAVVPTDIYLGDAFDTLIITGPNTGGKTVALKTLGLFTLMAMCGLMIPAAEGSQISIFENVLADIGDEQSIEQNLSTFSAHMVNIISILEKTDGRSLVLLDELGAGTDPVEGAALAISIIEALRRKGARIAATTHYAEIKLFALETEGVENGSCEFDVSSLRPTYKLSIGVPGKSNAFAISQRLGISPEVINRAKELVSYESTKFEDAVSQLEQTRQSLAKELEEAQLLRAQAQATKKEIAEYKANLDREKEREVEKARYEARRIVENVRAESEKLLDELQEIRKQKDSEAFSQLASKAKSQMRSNLNHLYDLSDPVAQKQQEAYKLPRPLVKGDTVFVTDLGAAGKVLSLPDKNGMVQVQAGAIKLTVKQSSLRLADPTPAKKGSRRPSNGSVSVSATKRAQRFSDAEIDLRGMNVEEGIMETDRFIDNAVMTGLHTLTLIHGKGTGVLRNAIHQHLRRHKNVRSFRLGVYGEGETGVTIVELK